MQYTLNPFTGQLTPVGSTGGGGGGVTTINTISPDGSGNFTFESTDSSITFVPITNGLNLLVSRIPSNLPITTVNHAQSPYAVLATDQYLSVDSTAGSVSLSFPNSTTTGRIVYIKDAKGQAFTNNIITSTPGAVVLFDASNNYVMNTNYQSIGVIFDGAAYEVF